MESKKEKKTGYFIREKTRLKHELPEFAVVVFLFVIVSLSLYRTGAIRPFFGIGLIFLFICIIVCFIIIRWDKLIQKKNPIVLSIDEDGVALRVTGKKPNGKKQIIYSKYYLMNIYWSGIEHIELRFTNTRPDEGWLVNAFLFVTPEEPCVHIKMKNNDEVWCSIGDYFFWLPSTSRRIRHAVYECTGRTDLFVDQTSRHKQKG